jgi:AcrR family transcriptional regulator
MARTSVHSFSSLVAPALEIVARHGLDMLTLRPLAHSAGVGLTTVTNIVGTKSELMKQLIDAARRLDHQARAPFRVMLAQPVKLTATELAEFCDLVLETLTQTSTPVTVFFCEAVQAAAYDDEINAALQPWLRDQEDFWRDLTRAAAASRADILAQALMAYSIDEMAHGCALGGLPDYRRLRRLCLVKLCEMMVEDPSGDKPQASFQAALFEHLFDALGLIEDTIGIDKVAHPSREAQIEGFAGAAAQILVHKGAGAVTHRAVAAEAHVAGSTLAYHFKTREDLIKGAMIHIIRRLKNSLYGEPAAQTANDPERSPYQAGYEIARSTYALALEASRRPIFLSSAADMRRKRGVNLKEIFNAERPDDQKIDMLTAQTLSVVSIGAGVLNSPKGITGAIETSYALIRQLMSAGA